MGAARTLLAGLLVLVCACGSASRPAAVVSPAKPSPEPSKVYSTPTAQPSTPPWTVPFESIDFIDRSHGWEVSLAQQGYKVEVARTSDGGATWSSPVTAASFYLGDTPIPRFGVRFANVNDGWVFAQGLFASTDGGVTWSATSVNAYVYDVAVYGSSVWAVTDRGLFRSQVGGTDWTPTPAPAPAATLGSMQLIRASASLAFISQQAQFETRLYRTTDGAATWKEVPTPCTRGYAMPFATLDGMHLWMICGSEPGAGNQAKWTYTSDDSGVHWALRAYNDGINRSGLMSTGGYAKLLTITSASTGFMADNRGDLYRSTDSGRTWKESGLAHASEGFFNALQFVDSSTGWFAGVIEGLTPDGTIGLYRTTDGGTTWNLVSSAAGGVA